MNITYGSVCSGIEAASVAWEPLGMKPAWFSEIEAFPSAVLAHHWPQVANLGDMTKIAAAVRAGTIPAPDIGVGGTPCQAFSVAGARAGLSDPRGQLTISYVELADAIDDTRTAAGKQPAIFVWENVPGVLSSKDNAFGAFLGFLAGEECELQPPGGKWKNAGYVRGPKRTLAWRVLDAQFFGVAQRRRRVFVVASARTDFDPAKVLFEPESVRRDTPPSRSAGSAVAALTANGVGTCGADDNQGQAGHLIAAFGGGNCSGALDVAACLTARGQRIDFEVETFLAQYSSTGKGAWSEGFGTLRAREQESHEHLAVMAVHGTQDPDTNVELAHTLGRNNGAENAVCCFTDTRGDTRGSGIQVTGEIANTLHCAKGLSEQQIVAIGATYSFNSKDHGQDAAEEISPTLRSAGHGTSHANAGAPPAVAYGFQPRIARNGRGDMGDVCHALTAEAGETGKGDSAPHVATRMSVRRLTPRECERLQGFPDDHTLIPYGKAIRPEKLEEDYAKYLMRGGRMTFDECCRAAADGPRYKAIGNSMAVPCMSFIGKRILQQLEGAM